MIKITKEDFNIDEVLSQIVDSETGGVVTFTGVVRRESEGRQVNKMEIEVYPEMAFSQLKKIREESLDQFEINEISIIHRYGTLNVGDNIVSISVAAKHRDEAFTACKYVIDELKKRVPLWKKEYTSEGEYWVEGDQPE